MKKSYVEPYKKIIINWYQGGLSYKHYIEKMIITKDKISFKRTVDCSTDDEVFDTIKWNIKVEDDSYVMKFFKLCESFVNNCDNFKMSGCDMSIMTIELILDDNTKIKEHYMGNIKDNDLEDFHKLIKDFVPKFVSKPYFL
jgi:hypothetical protein